MDMVITILGLSGWVLWVVAIIRFMIFNCKIMPRLIDDVNINLYPDLANKVQEMIDCPLYGTFRDSQVRKRLTWEATKLFLKLTISPEQTSLYADQRFYKVSGFLLALGGLLFLNPFFLISL